MIRRDFGAQDVSSTQAAIAGFSVLPAYRRIAMLSRPVKMGEAAQGFSCGCPTQAATRPKPRLCRLSMGVGLPESPVDLGCTQSLTACGMLSRNPVTWKEQAPRDFGGGGSSPGEVGPASDQLAVRRRLRSAELVAPNAGAWPQLNGWALPIRGSKQQPDLQSNLRATEILKRKPCCARITQELGGDPSENVGCSSPPSMSLRNTKRFGSLKGNRKPGSRT